MKRPHNLLILLILSGFLALLVTAGQPSGAAYVDSSRLPSDQAQKIRAHIKSTLKTWEVPGALSKTEGPFSSKASANATSKKNCQ
jgi:hypothetical protein